MARIALSEDLQVAELMLAAGERIDASAALALLGRVGVSHGIDMAALSSLPSVTGPATLVVARGTPAVEAVDAHIEFLCPNVIGELLPAVGPDGAARSISDDGVARVKAGDVLARKVPLVQPQAGCTVTGHLVQPAFARDVPLKAGPGTALSADRLSVVAAIDGVPYRAESLVMVRPELRIAGPVDARQGHVQFDGDVVISGGVAPRMEVRATGRITVRGDVEGARLAAGDDVVVYGKVRGGAMLESAGGIFAMAVEGSTIRCQQRLHVQLGLIGCNSEVLDSMIVGQELLGGNVRVGRSGTTGVLGSSEKVPTKIWVVPPAVDSDRLMELEQEHAKLQEVLTRLTPKLMATQAGNGAEPSAEAKKIQDLMGLLQQRDAMLIERKRNLSQVRTQTRARFAVRSVIYPEVSVFMGAAELKLDAPKAGCTLIEEAGEIRQLPFSELPPATM